MYPIDAPPLPFPLAFALIVLTAMMGAGWIVVALRTNRRGGRHRLTARYMLLGGISLLLTLLCSLIAR